VSIKYVTMIQVDCDGDPCRQAVTPAVFDDLFYAAGDATEAIGNSSWRTDGEHHWCPDCQRAPHDHTPERYEKSMCARCGDLIVEEVWATWAPGSRQ